MRYTNKIVILSCWFGPYPWYFPYFIHSCSYNHSIDFIIITDNENVIINKPENVKIIFKTMVGINGIASKKLGFKVNIDYPYKLCDFKPAYGFLFPEIIKGYDFWGHGDIDIVYGNIRNFMTNEILYKYDVISSRHDYITGTFCLFRNSEQMNNLFMQSKDYKKVFSSIEHYCFDECNFLFQELQNGASIFDYPDNIQSMTWVVKKAEADGKLKAFFDFIIIEGATGKIKWDKGRIIYKDTYEAMFYHLIKFKTQCKPPKILSPIPDIFYFTPKKIMAKQKSEISPI
ncbi:DUF6625 family protein [Ferruginibacter sp.]|nr:hypothetical protein [Ferruginibacter sp.]